MPQKDDLAKVERSIREAEIRLTTTKIKIEAQDKELFHLASLKNELESNIKNLKQKGVAAVASEYKKAKTDLLKTNVKITQIQWDKAVLQKIYDETLQLKKNGASALEAIVEKIGKNVLHGKFPKK